ncbi:MAG: BatA domain-containing protein [Planctomycetota bacterium]|nr:BatA domain-containing protein [Planctomycetota bacterium]
MTFEVPLALLGLAAVPILILLDRIRRRPRRTRWPSLAIWQAVVGVAEPTRRRAFDSLLLYECAAAALLSLAAAGPLLPGETAGRRVAVLFDEGPHMAAKGVREASLREWERLKDALDDNDRIIEFRTVDDLATAAAKLPPVDMRVVVTDRPGIDAPNLIVIGRTSGVPGVGIDAVELNGDELWFALGADGDVEAFPVRIGGQTIEVRPGEGRTVPFHGDTVRIQVMQNDAYAADNICDVERIRVPAMDQTGSRFVRAALFGAGLKAGPGSELVITREGGTGIAELVRGAECIATIPGLFDDLMLEESVWRGVKAREGAGLLAWRRRTIAAWVDERTLWLGMPVGRDWDDHGTLAVLIERAKRATAERLADGAAIRGDAYVRPRPGFVSTAGVDRDWDGVLPPPGNRAVESSALRTALALLAALLLAFYVRAIVQQR